LEVCGKGRNSIARDDEVNVVVMAKGKAMSEVHANCGSMALQACTRTIPPSPGTRETAST
jgi:hypothetical protein